MNHLQGGADSGYGAKAQEVLGQVKGRYVESVLYMSIKKGKILLSYFYFHSEPYEITAQ